MNRKAGYYVLGLLTFFLIAWKTTDNLMKLGDGQTGDKTIEFDVGSGATNPKLQWSDADQKIVFTNDGATVKAIGSGGGGSGTNLLQEQDGNHDFEAGSPPTNWTESGGTFVSETTDEGFGTQSGSWDASALSQTLTSADVVVNKGLEGRSCLAQGQYKYTGTLGDYVVRVELDDGTALTSDLQLSDTNGVWTKFNLAFLCPTSDSIHLEFASAVADPTIILIDDVHLGSDIREVEFSQATHQGSAFWLGATGCEWAVTSTTYGDFPEDTDCNNPTVSGELGTLSSKIPGFEITNAKPGKYQINFQGPIEKGSGVLANCRMVDQSDTLISEIRMQASSSGRQNETFSGVLDVATPGSYEIKLQCKSASGSVNILSSDSSERILKFEVYRFPNDVETAIQKPETQAWYVDVGIYEDGSNFSLAPNISAYQSINSSDGNMEVYPGSAPAGIACTTTTENDVGELTCSGGANESIGVVFEAPYSGLYEVCSAFAYHYDNVTADRRTGFQLVLTENNSQTILQEGNERLTNSSGPNTAEVKSSIYRLCGLFNLSAGKRTVRLFYETNISICNTDCRIEANREATTGQGDIHFTVRPWTQNFPEAVLVSNQSFQTKFLLADTTAGSGTVSDLAFNGLDIGSCYQVSFNAMLDHTSGVDSRYNAKIINSDTIDTNELIFFQGGETNGGGKPNSISGVRRFIALDSNVNLQIQSNPGGNTTLRGDATLPETYMQIENCPKFTTTTEWN